MENEFWVILRIRISRSVNNFRKCSDLGLVTEQFVFKLFRHQSVTEQVENQLFRHRQDHFQKYDYAFGFLFALTNPRVALVNPSISRGAY